MKKYSSAIEIKVHIPEIFSFDLTKNDEEVLKFKEKFRKILDIKGPNTKFKTTFAY
eukprot:gene12997-7734_t